MKLVVIRAPEEQMYVPGIEFVHLILGQVFRRINAFLEKVSVIALDIPQDGFRQEKGNAVLTGCECALLAVLARLAASGKQL